MNIVAIIAFVTCLLACHHHYHVRDIIALERIEGIACGFCLIGIITLIHYLYGINLLMLS